MFLTLQDVALMLWTKEHLYLIILQVAFGGSYRNCSRHVILQFCKFSVTNASFFQKYISYSLRSPLANARPAASLLILHFYFNILVASPKSANGEI